MLHYLIKLVTLLTGCSLNSTIYTLKFSYFIFIAYVLVFIQYSGFGTAETESFHFD